MSPLLMDALWGLIGGVGYAGTRLVTTLWSGPEIEARAQRLAIAQFIISLGLAPAAAGSFTPLVVSYVQSPVSSPIAFLMGLLFNAVWPLLVERGFLRKLLSDAMQGLADRMKPGA